ncbi:M48 family metallopeptidase [Thermonema rossianum]|uniref:M48 family metallopeptidase n=1 Tax=Thermonema rossianum TaxID=55505 RepID=UPI00056EB4CB|nr:M48 family metallopeptidase [Thermonema rossianum]
MKKPVKAAGALAGLALLYFLLVLMADGLLSDRRSLGAGWENQLGDLLWEELRSLYRESRDSTLTAMTGDIMQHLAEANGMDPDSLHLHILHAPEPNAVALPGGHVVVFTGLLRLTDTPEEFAAVLAHEMAHIQLNHISEKLLKEAGITMILAAAGGGSEISRLAAMLLSNAFSREAEQEADLRAVILLENACIDPQGLVSILQRFAAGDAALPEMPEWLSTHPLSKERVEYVRAALNKQQHRQTYCEVPGADRWETVRKAVEW